MTLADYIVEKYSDDQPRDDDGRWSSGGSAAREEQSARRSERARSSYNPLTKEKERLSNESEETLSQALGLPRTGDNDPFDLQSGRIGVEIKTLVDQKAGKLTIHPESRIEKLRVAEEGGLKPFTVAVDKRGDQHVYYARPGIGSYTLSSMKRFDTLAELKRYIR